MKKLSLIHSPNLHETNSQHLNPRTRFEMLSSLLGRKIKKKKKEQRERRKKKKKIPSVDYRRSIGASLQHLRPHFRQKSFLPRRNNRQWCGRVARRATRDDGASVWGRTSVQDDISAAADQTNSQHTTTRCTRSFADRPPSPPPFYLRRAILGRRGGPPRSRARNQCLRGDSDR